MNAMKPRPVVRLIGMALLSVGLLTAPSPVLQAQSAETPPAAEEPGTAAAPKKDPAPTGVDKPDPDRSRAYRRQQDELKPFAPSEEIRVDKAVDFPADI